MKNLSNVNDLFTWNVKDFQVKHVGFVQSEGTTPEM